MKVHIQKARTAGFSLVELLVVIAVIGIMAAVAIPMISNINEKAKTARNKRNAQNIASVYGAATADGATITASRAAAVVTALSTGVNGADQFADTKFQVNITTAEGKTAAAALLNDPVGGVLTTKF